MNRDVLIRVVWSVIAAFTSAGLAILIQILEGAQLRDASQLAGAATIVGWTLIAVPLVSLRPAQLGGHPIVAFLLGGVLGVISSAFLMLYNLPLVLLVLASTAKDLLHFHAAFLSGGSGMLLYTQAAARIRPKQRSSEPAPPTESIPFWAHTAAFAISLGAAVLSVAAFLTFGSTIRLVEDASYDRISVFIAVAENCLFIAILPAVVVFLILLFKSVRRRLGSPSAAFFWGTWIGLMTTVVLPLGMEAFTKHLPYRLRLGNLSFWSHSLYLVAAGLAGAVTLLSYGLILRRAKK